MLTPTVPAFAGFAVVVVVVVVLTVDDSVGVVAVAEVDDVAAEDCEAAAVVVLSVPCPRGTELTGRNTNFPLLFFLMMDVISMPGWTIMPCESSPSPDSSNCTLICTKSPVTPVALTFAAGVPFCLTPFTNKIKFSPPSVKKIRLDVCAIVCAKENTQIIAVNRCFIVLVFWFELIGFFLHLSRTLAMKLNKQFQKNLIALKSTIMPKEHLV